MVLAVFDIDDQFVSNLRLMGKCALVLPNIAIPTNVVLWATLDVDHIQEPSLVDDELRPLSGGGA